MITASVVEPGNFAPITFGLFGGSFKLFLQVLLFQGKYFHLLLNLCNFLQWEGKYLFFLKAHNVGFISKQKAA